MIANCPSCGTHYKHEAPPESVEARCGRCDAALVLSRARPYRIVPVRMPSGREAAIVAAYSSIGVDDPALVTEIARNVPETVIDAPVLRAHPAHEHVAAPPIVLAPHPAVAVPEAAPAEAAPATAAPAEVEVRPARKSSSAFPLWLAASAMVGIAASWWIGGGTIDGLAWGAGAGAVVWWGWRRWISPR